MGHTARMCSRLAVGVVAVGTLALGGAGVAGAAAPSGTGAGAPVVAVASGRLAHFDCARAGRVLARIQKAEDRIAAGLPKLTAAEAKAKAAGKTARAARIQKRITHLESPAVSARLHRVSAAIGAKCQVSVPSATTGPSTTTPPTTTPGA